MGSKSAGNIRSILKPDGSCTTCGKSATGCSVTCFMCLVKFHAVGCSVDANICTQTFLNSYTPLSDKSGVNNFRPGNFKFICDFCLTAFENEQAKTSTDKFNCLEDRVGKIDESVNAMKDDLKKLLLHSAGQGIVSDTASSVTPRNSSRWGNNLGRSNGNNVPPISPSPEAKLSPHVDENPKSILVIDNNGEEKENTIDALEKVVLDSNIGIKNSYDNKKGNTVVICNSDEQRDLLHTKLKEALPDISAKPLSNNLSKTIAVVGFSPTYNESNLLGTILKQNEFINSFINLKGKGVPENHLKLLHVKPLKNNPQLNQGVFKVSSAFRALLEKFHDKLLVGIRNVTVYERIFVKRCFGCQKYGHIHGKCPTPQVIKCANCGEDHETRSCNAAAHQAKCVNCHRHGTSDCNHSASSTNCPVYQAELNRLKDLN